MTVRWDFKFLKRTRHVMLAQIALMESHQYLARNRVFSVSKARSIMVSGISLQAVLLAAYVAQLLFTRGRKRIYLGLLHSQACPNDSKRCPLESRQAGCLQSDLVSPIPEMRISSCGKPDDVGICTRDFKHDATNTLQRIGGDEACVLSSQA